MTVAVAPTPPLRPASSTPKRFPVFRIKDAVVKISGKAGRYETRCIAEDPGRSQMSPSSCNSGARVWFKSQRTRVRANSRRRPGSPARDLQRRCLCAEYPEQSGKIDSLSTCRYCPQGRCWAKSPPTWSGERPASADLESGSRRAIGPDSSLLGEVSVSHRIAARDARSGAFAADLDRCRYRRQVPAGQAPGRPDADGRRSSLSRWCRATARAPAAWLSGDQG